MPLKTHGSVDLTGTPSILSGLNVEPKLLGKSEINMKQMATGELSF